MADRPASTPSGPHGTTPDALPEALAELVGSTVSLADRWVALDPDTLTVTEAGQLAEGG